MRVTVTKRAISIAVMSVLLFGVAGCEQTMQTPGSREQAHQRCVQAKGKWEETPSNWRCNK